MKILYLLFIFISLSCFGQDNEAALYFKDGTKVLGYASLELKDRLFNPSFVPKILFRVSKEKEADEWDYEMIDKVVFYFFEDVKTFKYVDFQEKNNKIKHLLLEEITEGTVGLYKEIQESSFIPNVGFNNISNPNYTVNPTFSGSSVNVNFERSASPMILVGAASKRSRHYLLRQNDQSATILRPFIKDITEYFKDCPGIKKKLKSGEITIRDLQYIVEYYNDYCVGYEFDAEDYETKSATEESDDQ